LIYINNSRVGGLIFLLVSGAYGYFATEIPLDFFSETESFNARSLPLVIAAVGITISLLLLFLPTDTTTDTTVDSSDGRQQPGPPPGLDPVETHRSSALAPALLLIGLLLGFGYCLEYLGFLVTTSLFLLSAFRVLGETRWLIMITVSLSIPLGFWLLMDTLGIFLSHGAFVEQILG
jgi:putative tricarboxylic transport membrane protein